jgi:hypothetical protein
MTYAKAFLILLNVLSSLTTAIFIAADHKLKHPLIFSNKHLTLFSNDPQKPVLVFSSQKLNVLSSTKIKTSPNLQYIS